MAMTKKHFDQLAAIIRDANNYNRTQAEDNQERTHAGICLRMVQAALSGYCASQNPNFDAGRFYEACQLVEGK